MNTLLVINWNPDPELFNIFGLSIRYYGLLWVTGLVLGYFIVQRQYRDKKIPEVIFEPLFLYCFLGVLIGARLGHCLFYEPDYYLKSWQTFVEMILPIRLFPTGGWKFVGYAGLSSHGGIFGMLIGFWLYCRKTKMKYIDVLDMVAVAAPLTAFFIRMANLMNSEIIGNVTNVSWAFVFHRVDEMPRHPAQLYEALAYLLLFFVMVFLYKKYDKKLKQGFYFGLCLGYIFVFRFLVEFIKEDQVDFEAGMTLNMGQWLSIPLALVGLFFMFRPQKEK